MLPLYLARVEDLEQGDFVKIECAACHHVALLTPAALLKLGLSPAAKVLDLTMRGQVPRLRSAGASRGFGQVGAPEWLSGCPATPAPGATAGDADCQNDHHKIVQLILDARGR